MKAISQECDRLNAQIRRTADLAVQMLERIRGDLTPARLQEMQDALRADLLWNELRIRALCSRRKTRSERLRSRFGDRPWWSECIGDHIRLLSEREGLLQYRRTLLKQAGDALAWIVLREDPDILIPLYAPRTHHLPSGVGLAGQIQVVTTGNATGEFFVLENDLTRVLGIGDVTVVTTDNTWVRPLSFEIKTSGAFVLGAFVEIDLSSAVASSGPDSAMLDRFCAALGLSRRPDDAGVEPPQKQLHDLTRSAELQVAVLTRRAHRLSAQAPDRWPVINRIARRGLENGHHMQVVEDGIAYAAVATPTGDRGAQEMQAVVGELKSAGFREGLHHVTTYDFQEIDYLSPITPPILLWPLDQDLRTEILARELILFCVFDRDVWSDAMTREGITLDVDEDEWVVSIGARSGRFAHLDKLKLELGLAFGAVSPADVARAVREGLEDETGAA